MQGSPGLVGRDENVFRFALDLQEAKPLTTHVKRSLDLLILAKVTVFTRLFFSQVTIHVELFQDFQELVLFLFGLQP